MDYNSCDRCSTTDETNDKWYKTNTSRCIKCHYQYCKMCISDGGVSFSRFCLQDDSTELPGLCGRCVEDNKMYVKEELDNRSLYIHYCRGCYELEIKFEEIYKANMCKICYKYLEGTGLNHEEIVKIASKNNLSVGPCKSCEVEEIPDCVECKYRNGAPL